MEAYLKAHPYLKETAELYLAMGKAIKAAAKPLAFPARKALAESAKGAFPVLQQFELQAETVRTAASTLPAALAALARIPAPSKMQDALAAWAIWAKRAKAEERQAFFDNLLRQEDQEIRDFASREKLSEPILRTVGWAILAALVPDDVKSAELWEEVGWQHNYCPVCGRKPVMAQLRKEKEGRARFLACDGCHTVWPYARIGCAYCGNKDLRKMHILEPEGEESMRLDVCDVCRTYLKTYQKEGEEDVYLHDWATLHLDMIGEEKGLRKEGSVLLPSE